MSHVTRIIINNNIIVLSVGAENKSRQDANRRESNVVVVGLWRLRYPRAADDRVTSLKRRSEITFGNPV